MAGWGQEHWVLRPGCCPGRCELSCTWEPPVAKPEKALGRDKIPELWTKWGERVLHTHFPPGHWFQCSLADLN